MVRMMNMKRSGGKEKVMNLLEEFTDSDFFQSEVVRIRKQFAIPPGGLDLTETDRKDLMKSDFFHIPKALVGGRESSKAIYLEIRKIAHKLAVNGIGIRHFLRLYLFYNIMFPDVPWLDEENLLKFVNLDDQYWERWDDDEEYQKDFLRDLQIENAQYPLAIRIHPAASQRDLLDYVKKQWHLIHEHQLKYLPGVRKVKYFPKIRARKPGIRERNRFIFRNRSLPYKKIVSLVAEKFSKELSRTVDEGSVGKIISIERKRRKQV